MRVRAGQLFGVGGKLYADPRRGELIVFETDGSGMHIAWRDRVSGAVSLVCAASGAGRPFP
jgi:hypothetical protein